MAFVAALAAMLLGIRAGHRASGDHERAMEADRCVTDIRQPDGIECTYFYETATAVVVVNGSDRVMPVRLVLPDKGVRWGEVQLAPCRQLVIPSAGLLMSMKAAAPSVGLGPAQLEQLQLEVTDPGGLVWRRTSSGVATPAPPGAPPSGTGLVDYAESWTANAKNSPVCTAS
ncbi:hypothetical protein ACFVGM_34295 [Kitasatospora purpeofusca]|uniref:hypothetical protein n=1 Tax=Kitasatospora purpeofusca TaxID=67352 RepID=UPI003692274B